MWAPDSALERRACLLFQTLVGSTSVTFGASYNPASQVLSLSSTNAAYVSHPAGAATAYVANGLNRYAPVGGTSFSYDGKGNLTSDGTRTFTYDVENRLLSETGGPRTSPSATTRSGGCRRPSARPPPSSSTPAGG